MRNKYQLLLEFIHFQRLHDHYIFMKTQRNIRILLHNVYGQEFIVYQSNRYLKPIL